LSGEQKFSVNLTTENFAQQGPTVAEYYRQRSSAGLLISEATAISDTGFGWDGAPGIYNAEHVAGWKTVTDTVHSAGGVIYCQLWHMGRQTLSDFFGIQPVSASAIAAAGDSHGPGNIKKAYEVPRALELHELPKVVEEYRHAAVMAKEAGFDGVEIHGANGYLLDQFLQSVSNHRTDAYGGPVENRFRLLREVFAAVSTVFPADRIGVRLSPNGMYGSMGSEDNFETFQYAIAELNALNVGYLHVMDGVGRGFHGKCKVFTLAVCACTFFGHLFVFFLFLLSSDRMCELFIVEPLLATQVTLNKLLRKRSRPEMLT
jgi:N-ethylmaleimide reductase